jgi:hypothetical protein
MLCALMSIPSLPPYRRDVPCPKCPGGGEANASVGVGPRFRMVRYECPLCGHEWFTQEMLRARVLPFTPRASSPFRSFKPQDS